MIQIHQPQDIDTVGATPFDPIKRILQYPFYRHSFRIYPMEDEYFSGKILLNIKPGRPILSDSWLEIYMHDSKTNICRTTMYN